MNSSIRNLHHFLAFALLVLVRPILALNDDGVLLLSLKYAILSDPLSALDAWNYNDETPCAWNGVTCTELGPPGSADMFRVTSLILPNSQLLGAIPSDLGMLEHLRHLDLSNNFFNGSLPLSIFNASELQVLSLSNNVISGELPQVIGELKSLQLLNLSDNAFAGEIPENLTALQNLTVVSLKSNYFTGGVPSGFGFVQVLDLSSNLLNGSLPIDFGGDNLHYLNASYNKISGSIPAEFAKKIPQNSTIDVSFNNLTGAIPESVALLNQKTEMFAGNADLCGRPLKDLCSIPSTLSAPPNVSTTSTPAIAAIPKNIDSGSGSNSNSPTSSAQDQPQEGGLKPSTIAGIVVGDLAGIGILAMVILYVYQLKTKKKSSQESIVNKSQMKPEAMTTVTIEDQVSRKPTTAWSCLTVKGEETSETTSSESDPDEQNGVFQGNQSKTIQQGGSVVAVDGETKLEVETLLKASAYILGTSSGGSIVYKAVLEDGTTLAVRRIGENGAMKFKEFESQVKAISKLRHPNLVKVRGFYWGDDEKLVIYNFVNNGSLATTTGYRRPGASPCNLPLDTRLKIAKGLARGLCYIHEKKYIHGNIKPNNILLTSDMEAVISDLGLDKLISGNNSYKESLASSRHFGSQRSTISRDGMQDIPVNASPSMATTSSGASPYQAPESLKNLKPNPKWDIYSFGIVLLELITGRILSERELSQWTSCSLVEEKNRLLRLADVAIRADVEAREDAMLSCFRLGFNCASMVPQKRPSMKEAVQVLEKIPCSLI